MTTDDTTSPTPPPIAPQQTAAQPAAPSRFWRFVKALLMPWPVSGRWAWRKVRKCPGWAIAVTTVIVAVAFIYRQPIWDFVSGAEDGKIFVNSPTVYTRQRLVNDRLDQAGWLRSQLKTTEKLDDREFRSIDQYRNVYGDTHVSIGGKNSTPPDKPAAATSVTIEATTAALFRAKNAYREEVRSEITQTELDDRHDIKGNTIFRLAFDASVLAGTKRDSVAGISIRLSHRPEHAEGVNKQIYDEDYQSLYEDWARYFQDTIRKSLAIVPKSIASSEPIPQLRIFFSDFLTSRICQFIELDPDLRKDPVKCVGTAKVRAEQLLADYTKMRFLTLQEDRDARFRNAIAGYATARFQLPPGDLNQLIGTASLRCAADGKTEIALWEMKIKSPASQASLPAPTNADRTQDATVLPAPLKQVSGQQIPAGQQAQESAAKPDLPEDRIGCPFYPSQPERLISGVLLYEQLYSIARRSRAGTLAAQPSIVKAGDYQGQWELAKAEIANCNYGACNVDTARLRCFAADFVKSNLNSFHVPPSESKWQKISHYLNLEIVGRDVNDCNILVTTLPNPSLNIDNTPYEPLHEFVNRLNLGTDAFAYSVTPKNLTENISTANEARDAFELMLRTVGESKDIANLLRQRAEQARAIVSHPIVVGFGSPSDARKIDQASAGIRDIDFGWVIAPHARIDGRFEQIDGQYTLTAFISVPGWWRTVELEIRNCWLARTGLGNVKIAQDICPPNSKKKSTAFTIRLPSAIPEISRKLGFDVVQQPSLYEPVAKELVVGRPGALLLDGARLWRSTEVTAAAQRADKISVLPNMEGILAEFNCVLPPAVKRQQRRNNQVTKDDPQTISTDFVRVWTSEGVTEPLPVTFVWPDDWQELLAACKNPGLAQAERKKSPAPVKASGDVTPPSPPKASGDVTPPPPP